MKLTRAKISKRTVDSLEVEKDTVFWDSELIGFGIRAYPTGGRYYIVQARTGGKSGKRVTIGRHGVITAAEARRRAILIISRIKSGKGPPIQAKGPADSPTMEELAHHWLEEYVDLRCKPKTRQMYRLMVEKHLLPMLGKEKALSINRARVTDLHHSLRATPAMANQVVNVFSRIWKYVEDHGRLPEGSNPCRGVAKFRNHRRERFLSETEFRRLGRVLSEAETCGRISLYAVAAIRLLLLTGCRKSEILTLKWDEVNLKAQELNLSDSKTGRRTIPLSREATDVLAQIPRVAGNLHVIPGKVEGKPIRNLNGSWDIIRKQARLGDVRIHDLRHSFASRALALGESLAAIGSLLGHTQVETTARYAHLAQDSVREAAVRISDSIAVNILKEYRPADKHP